MTTYFQERVWELHTPTEPVGENIKWERRPENQWVSRPATQEDIERRRLVHEMLTSQDEARRKEIADYLKEPTPEGWRKPEAA